MATVSNPTLDTIETYLMSIDDHFDPLTADGGWMIQRVKDWTEARSLGRSDYDASDIVIALVQRAGRPARPLPAADAAQLRTDVTTLARAVLDLLATAGSLRATSWQTAVGGVVGRGTTGT